MNEPITPRAKAAAEWVATCVSALTACPHLKTSTLVVAREYGTTQQRYEQLVCCVDCGALLYGAEWHPPEALVRLQGALAEFTALKGSSTTEGYVDGRCVKCGGLGPGHTCLNP